MVRVKKRASKRTSTKQREKVKRKVAEHHRKARRAAKKDPTWRSKKKVDPGIPNSFPFKQQLIDEVKEKRRKAEEDKLKAKEARKNGVAQQGDEEEQGISSAEEEREEVEDEIQVAEPEPFKEPVEHREGLPELLQQVGKDVKAVLFALDARDPNAWRLEELEASVKEKGAETVLVLTKADLVPLEVVAAWSQRLQELTSLQTFVVAAPPPPTGPGSSKKASVVPGGSDALAKHLTSVVGKGEASVAVVGLENSGKTTLSLALAAALGPDTGITLLDTSPIVQATSRLALLSIEEAAELEAIQDREEEEEEELDDDVLEDLSAKRDAEGAMRILLRNKGSIYKIKEPLPLVHALISRIAQPTDLMLVYHTPAFGSFVPAKVPSIDEMEGRDEEEKERERDIAVRMSLREKVEKDAEEFLVGVARVRGRQKRLGVPDTIAAARIVLRDWSVNELGYYVPCPKPTSDAEKVKAAVAKEQERLVEDATLADKLLARREWKEKMAGREVRMKDMGHGMLEGRLALAVWPDMEVDEEDGDEEEGEEDEDEEESEEEAPAPAPKSILKQTTKGSDKKRKADSGGAADAKKARVSIDAAPRTKESRREILASSKRAAAEKAEGGEVQTAADGVEVRATGAASAKRSKLPNLKAKSLNAPSPLSRKEARLKKKDEIRKRIANEEKKRAATAAAAK